MVTYGEKQINIWAELQHMGNIWADVVIFALKVSTSEHMGNIWETYGEHTLYGQYPE